MNREMNKQVNYNYTKSQMNYMSEEKYPDVYKIMNPIVAQMIADMENRYGNIEMTDELFNSMVEGVIEKSGLIGQVNMPADRPLNMDNTDMTMPNAMPVMNMGGYRHHRDGYNRHDYHGDGYWGHHDHSTLGDVASILLLGQIFGGRRPRWKW